MAFKQKSLSGTNHQTVLGDDPYVTKRAERLERDNSKRDRKEQISNARKRQSFFGYRSL